MQRIFQALRSNCSSPLKTTREMLKFIMSRNSPSSKQFIFVSSTCSLLLFKSLERQTYKMDCWGFCRAHSLIPLSPADISHWWRFVTDPWEIPAAIAEPSELGHCWKPGRSQYPYVYTAAQESCALNKIQGTCKSIDFYDWINCN